MNQTDKGPEGNEEEVVSYSEIKYLSLDNESSATRDSSLIIEDDDLGR